MLRPDDRRVGFGVTLLPNAIPEFLSWCRTAEASGFDTIGIGDSQSLYREAFLTAALCAQETKHVKFGPRVINPMTRHPAISASGAATLQEIAPGRAVLGIGSGDSSVHNAGVRPARLAEMREYTVAIRDMLTKGEAQYHGETTKFTWGPVDVPLYVAASGPKTLELAGEIADGVIIQTGLLPEVIEDLLAHVRRGAEKAGATTTRSTRPGSPGSASGRAARRRSNASSIRSRPAPSTSPASPPRASTSRPSSSTRCARPRSATASTSTRCRAATTSR